MTKSRWVLLFAATPLIVGCASAPPRNAAVAAQGSNAKLPGQQNLQQLAQREAAAPAPSQPTAVPVPPGVEPSSVALHPAGDPRAFLSLADVLAQYKDKLNQSLLQTQPAPVDPDRAAQALHHYAKGRAAALDGRTLQAIVELQKAAELDPSSVEVLRELARCHLAENRAAQAVDLYERLLQIDPANIEALYAVGIAGANRRDFDQTIAALGRLRSMDEFAQRDPGTRLLVDFTLASALRELGYDRASIEASLLVADLPENIMESDDTMRLAAIYRQRGETWRNIGDAHCRLGEYDLALAAYRKAVGMPSADPLALRARMMYVNLSLNRPYSAQLELLNGLNLPRPSLTDREIRLCAYVRDQAGPVDALAQIISEASRSNPDESSWVRASAALLPPEQSREMLRQFVARKPRDLDGVAQLLNWLAQRDAREAADLAVALAAEYPDLADAYTDRFTVAMPGPGPALEVVRTLPASPARAHLEAKLLWKSGGMGEAWTVNTQARQQWPDNRALAIQQLQLGAALQEPALVEEALQSMPAFDDAPGLINLSQVRRALGQMDQAIALAQQAVDRDPTSVDAVVELARTHLAAAAAMAGDPDSKLQARSEVDRAIELANKALEMDPARESAFEVLTLIYKSGGVLADTALFRQTVQRLRDAAPQSPLLARLAIQDAIGQKRYEQALDRLLSLYDASPTDSSVVTLAVTTWQQWGKLDAAERWLNEQLAKRPGDPTLLEQSVRVQLLQNQSDAAVKRLEKMVHDSPADLYAKRLLETVYRATGQLDSAMELGEQRLLARPQGIRREIELAALYAGAELATRALDRLEWIDQNAARANLDELAAAVRILARLKTEDQRRDALNLKLVDFTIKKFPNAPLQVYGSGLRALARKAGEGELDEKFDALAELAAVHSKGGSGTSRAAADEWRELAQALIDDGSPAAAARAVRARFRAGTPVDDDAIGPLAVIALVADAAADAAHPDPQNVQRSIELLRLLDSKGKLARAIEADQRVSLASAMYETSVYYTMLGSRGGSNRLLREAIRLDPTQAMAMNNLGYAQLEAGASDDETVRLIEKAYELMPNEPNVMDTAGWLRYKQGRFADEKDPGTGEAVLGAVSLVQSSMKLASTPSPEVLDHLGDARWRQGDIHGAIAAWEQAVKLVENENFRKFITQNLQVDQARSWQLLVFDPGVIYDREYGPILERARAKLSAAQAGGQPNIAPTFAEAAAANHEKSDNP